MEERYLRINSCTLCPYTGHASNRHTNTITFICCNPIHYGMDKPKGEWHPCVPLLERIGDKFYPITHITKDIHDNPIPDWCKLPSKVAE